MHPENFPVIMLASGSPRRKELLEMAGFRLRVQLSGQAVSEEPKLHWSVQDTAAYLAQRKGSAACSLLHEDEVLLAADSVVIVDNTILGKPANKGEAISMILQLSNRVHSVTTGVYMVYRNMEVCFSDTTYVKVAPVTEAEAHFYVTNYRPMDKAGSYGIQEWFGLCKVQSIEGSYSNVVGLPVERVYHQMAQWYKEF